MFAYVLDCLPLINAAALLWNVATIPFEYLVVLNPMLVALEPITCAVTLTLDVVSTTQFTELSPFNLMSDAPVVDTVLVIPIAFVLLPFSFLSSLNTPTTSLITICVKLAEDTTPFAPELVMLMSVTLAVVPGAPATKILSLAIKVPNTPFIDITVEFVIDATTPFAPDSSELTISLVLKILVKSAPSSAIVIVTKLSSSTSSFTSKV